MYRQLSYPSRFYLGYTKHSFFYTKLRHDVHTHTLRRAWTHRSAHNKTLTKLTDKVSLMKNSWGHFVLLDTHHSNTHIHTQTNKHLHTQRHTLTLTQTHTYTDTDTHTHIHKHKHRQNTLWRYRQCIDNCPIPQAPWLLSINGAKLHLFCSYHSRTN